MDRQFEKLKQEAEDDLGRGMDADEERLLRALLFFGKGVKLKVQVDSEIARRQKVVSAIGEFLAGKKRPKQRLLHGDSHE